MLPYRRLARDFSLIILIHILFWLHASNHNGPIGFGARRQSMGGCLLLNGNIKYGFFFSVLFGEDLLLAQALATPGHALFFLPKEKKRECGSGKLVNLGSRGNSLEMPSLWKTSSVLTEPGVSKTRYY
ncbi:hypothetical protein J3E68DRAFT_398947 [Trichoderma sp. SZMC 28012]